MPLILVLIIILVQYGLIFSAYATVRRASAAGARASVVDGVDDATAEKAALAALRPLLDPNRAIVSISPVPTIPGLCTSPNCGKTLSLQYPLPVLLPFLISGANGSTLMLKGVSTLR
jgi:Flp pilus assembly protein TadG